MRGRWGWIALAAAAAWFLWPLDAEATVDISSAVNAGIGPADKLRGLTGPMLNRLIELKRLTDQAGLRWVIVSGYRSLAEQQRLYERSQAGLSDLPAAPPWRCTYHCTGRAVDVKLVGPTGTLLDTWSATTPWTTFGPLAERAGFVWGGRWGTWGVRKSGWDPVHIELHAG